MGGAEEGGKRDQQSGKEEEEEFNFNGFSIVEEMERGRPCSKFIILNQEEKRLCKAYSKTLITKLLGT